MQYWIPKSLVLGVAVSLAGCSVFTNDAHHERNYRVNAPVKVPDGLQQPYRDPEFSMPVATYDNSPEAKSYQAPQQILTLAQGSWVEEGEQKARVYFDKNDGIDDLPSFIWQAVDGVMQANEISYTESRKSEGEAISDWYTLVARESGWFWFEDKVVSEQKIKFIVEQKEHQRTASIRAELVDYRSDSVELNDLLKQRLEVRAINQVVAEFDYQYRLLQVEMRKRQGIMALDLGFDKDGNAALLTEKDQQNVLNRFATFLERNNFSVVRIDSEKQDILIRYKAPEESVWDSIWGDEAIVLPIEDGDYNVRISETDDKRTAITWKDGDGNVLDTDTMAEIHKVLLELLRQKGLTI
ncbi:outer membrane protein assembly factor BamC [Pseudoalteromonas sp. T1lg65]|uniref:outer membrane protein assembly factor BamC n=1 Tax=Pseudoalteromonas sp. T1lg65 TaxID=2077101 RepID=UPI003F7A5A2C